MQRYLIERELPGIGDASNADLRAASQRSNEALARLGKDVQWIESYVTPNGTVCVYLAESEDLIRQHASMAGFPANRITAVRRLIDPTTAGAVARLRS